MRLKSYKGTEEILYFSSEDEDCWRGSSLPVDRFLEGAVTPSGFKRALMEDMLV
jgi:hypothetical protein